MVSLLAKNSKAGCLLAKILKEVVTEIRKMGHLRQKVSKYPPPGYSNNMTKRLQLENT